MESRTERLASEVLALPESARARLAGKLLDSLGAEDFDPGASEAWAAETARRVAEIEAGTAKTRPWAQVRRDLLRSRREAKRSPIPRRSGR